MPHLIEIKLESLLTHKKWAGLYFSSSTLILFLRSSALFSLRSFTLERLGKDAFATHVFAVTSPHVPIQESSCVRSSPWWRCAAWTRSPSLGQRPCPDPCDWIPWLLRSHPTPSALSQVSLLPTFPPAPAEHARWVVFPGKPNHCSPRRRVCGPAKRPWCGFKASRSLLFVIQCLQALIVWDFRKQKHIEFGWISINSHVVMSVKWTCLLPIRRLDEGAAIRCGLVSGLCIVSPELQCDVFFTKLSSNVFCCFFNQPCLLEKSVQIWFSSLWVRLCKCDAKPIISRICERGVKGQTCASSRLWPGHVWSGGWKTIKQTCYLLHSWRGGDLALLCAALWLCSSESAALCCAFISRPSQIKMKGMCLSLTPCHKAHTHCVDRSSVSSSWASSVIFLVKDWNVNRG